MNELKITIGLSPSLMAIVSAIVANAGISVSIGGEANAGNSTLTSGSTPAAPASAPSAPNSPAPTGAPAAPANPEANGDDIDSHGHPWSAELHASTKGKTKEGLWRMKVGVSRPAPLPGFPKDGAGSAPAPAGSASPVPPSNTPAPPAPPSPPAPPADPNRPTDAAFRHDNGDGTEQWHVNGAWDGGKHPIPSGAPAAPAAAEEEDEFAKFATGANAAPAAARSWTDADLSKLCNQAALAAGGPEKVKPIIAEFMPEGVTPHSRHVPEAKREEFAQKVEQAHGITYAG